MSLLTRCPHCRTLFRVTPAQLQAHAGDVRCGRCMQVFDGFEALAVEAPRADDAPAEATAASGAGAPSSGGSGSPIAAEPVAVLPRVDAAPPAAGAASASPHAPSRLVDAPSMRIAACIALALLLATQIAYAFRGELAARSALLKTVVAGACGIAGCTVPLPQRPDLVRIEASDVRMIDAKQPALIQLTATLRSYAAHDLAYPALDLVLTNAQEHALARRIFLPEDYLGSTSDVQSGMPPHREVTVALDLDTGELNASGFRIDLIAAPGP